MADGFLKESTKSIVEHAAIAPPAFITATSLFGVSWQNVVYILTAVYTLFHIIRYVPKLCACFSCFVIDRRKCDNRCKIRSTE